MNFYEPAYLSRYISLSYVCIQRLWLENPSRSVEFRIIHNPVSSADGIIAPRKGFRIFARTESKILNSFSTNPHSHHFSQPRTSFFYV
jgi:hypothetical protein